MSERSIFLLLILLVWFLVFAFGACNHLLNYAMQIADHPGDSSFQPSVERWVVPFSWAGPLCLLAVLGSFVLDFIGRGKRMSSSTKEE